MSSEGEEAEYNSSVSQQDENPSNITNSTDEILVMEDESQSIDQTDLKNYLNPENNIECGQNLLKPEPIINSHPTPGPTESSTIILIESDNDDIASQIAQPDPKPDGSHTLILSNNSFSLEVTNIETSAIPTQQFYLHNAFSDDIDKNNLFNETDEPKTFIITHEYDDNQKHGAKNVKIDISEIQDLKEENSKPDITPVENKVSSENDTNLNLNKKTLIVDGREYQLSTVLEDGRYYNFSEIPISVFSSSYDKTVLQSASKQFQEQILTSNINVSESDIPKPHEVYFHYEEVTEVSSADDSHHSVTSQDEEQVEWDSLKSFELPRPAKSKPKRLTGNLLNSVSSEEFEDVYQFDGKGIWNSYCIDLHTNLKQWGPQSIDMLIHPHKLSELAPIEKRISIGDQTFKLVPQDNNSWNLYRAISQAVSGTEKNYKQIREDILSEIISNWKLYCVEMCDECSFNMLRIISPDKPDVLLSAYKSHYRSLSSFAGAPILHLKAAGRKYEFNYVVIDSEKNDGYARYFNSNDTEIREKNPERIYYFLKSNSPSQSYGTWRYQFLNPMGSIIYHIDDGLYSLFACDALVVDRQWELDEGLETQTNFIDNNFNLGLEEEERPPLCFGLNHNLFAYKPTLTHDLWSILSELQFKNLKGAPIIYEAVLRTKLEDSKYYLLSKLHKRKLKGRGCNEKLRKQYIKSLQVPPPAEHRGNTQDLIQAANCFNFSFTLIGLDYNGNLFWKECLKEPSESETQPFPNLALFVRLTENKEAYWYALESYEKLGSDADVTKGHTGNNLDERVSGRAAYPPAKPCAIHLSAKQSSTFSTFSDILSKVHMGRKWLAEKVTNASSTVYQKGSGSTVIFSLNKRVTNWLYRLRSVRVAPEFDTEENFDRKFNTSS